MRVIEDGQEVDRSSGRPTPTREPWRLLPPLFWPRSPGSSSRSTTGMATGDSSKLERTGRIAGGPLRRGRRRIVVTAAASLAITAMLFPANQWGAFIGGRCCRSRLRPPRMCLGSLFGRVSGAPIALSGHSPTRASPRATSAPGTAARARAPPRLRPEPGTLIYAGLTEEFDETQGLHPRSGLGDRPRARWRSCSASRVLVSRADARATHDTCGSRKGARTTRPVRE